MSTGLAIYTLIHVAISLAAIVSGFIVVFGMLSSQQPNSWTKVFLATSVLTDVTGFFFAFHGITPAIVVGIISLAVLAVVIFARRSRNLAGAWRKTYVIGSVFALYLNVLVLIAQIFQKVPGLKAIAPTQSEPPFVVAQLFVLVLFIVIGVFATIRFRDGLIRPAQI
jgi:hypothetical protein